MMHASLGCIGMRHASGHVHVLGFLRGGMLVGAFGVAVCLACTHVVCSVRFSFLFFDVLCVQSLFAV